MRREMIICFGVKRLLLPPIAAILLSAWLFPACAQSIAASGVISGVVVDPSGKAVPGAEVILVNNDLAITRSIVTSESGGFTAASVPSGTYTLRAHAPGLTLRRPAQVALGTHSSVSIKLQLALASVTQTTTVRGRNATVEGNTVQPEVNKQEVQMSNSIAGLEVTYLPNRDRDFTQFGQLVPGAEPAAYGGGLLVAGQQANFSKSEVDGADFDDPLEGGQRGLRDGALFFPQTAVREFQIVHAGATAEIGGTNAGFLNIVTKEGSNKLHGEAFYIGRPPQLTSRDAFGHSLDDAQNEFGGSLGGPIKRGRAFFFIGAEQDFVHVPYWTRFAPQAPGTVIPATLLGQQSQVTEKSDPTALFTRADVIVNTGNTLSVQFDYNRIRAPNLSSGSAASIAAPANGISLSGESYWGRANLGTVVGSRMVNQLLGQWSRDNRNLLPNENSPEIVIDGFGVLGGNSSAPHQYISTQREVSDDLSLAEGAHLIEFGGSFADDPAQEQHEANLNGRFEFRSLADYLADTPQRYQQTFAVGDTLYRGTLRQAGLYATARLTLTKNFTLAAGLRWSGQWNPQPLHPNAAIAAISEIPNDLGEWQPRLGIAWSPLTNTVVRISAGLYDAPTPATTFQRIFTDNGASTVVADSYYDPEILALVAESGEGFHSLAAPPVVLEAPAALVFGIARAFHDPRSFQVSGTVDQKLNRKIDFSAGFLRNSTWNLPQIVNENLYPPAIDSAGMPIFPATRPIPDIGQLLIVESSAHSTYDGLLLTSNFHLSRRSQLTANYTLSSTRDNDPSRGPFAIDSVLDPLDLALDRAPSSQDGRHNFNLSGVYNLPLGFKFNPIFVARSGLPYTPVIGFDTQNDGNDLNDRAIIDGRVAGRNSFRQPAFYDLDVRIVKDITLRGEGHHLDLFMDVFNVTGAGDLNFGPDAVSFYGTPASPVFSAGRPLYAPDTTALGSARQFQFTARLVAF